MLVDDLTVSGLLRVLREMQADKLTCDQINEISGEDLSTLVQNLSDISDKLSTIQSTIDQCETDASTFKTGIADAIKGVDSTATVTGNSSLPDFTSGIQNIVPNVTSDATAAAGHILSGKTAYVNGNKVTGTMNNYSGVETPRGSTANITSVVKECNIDVGGYYGVVSFHPCFTGYIDTNTVINQVVYGLNPNVIKAGQLIGAYGGSGDSAITGTFTSDATATDDLIASGYTAYVNGSKVTGSLPQLGGGVFGDHGSSTSFDNSPITWGGSNDYVGAFDYPLYGYFPNGTHRVHIPNLLPNNIKAGVKVGGKNGYITGTFTSDATAAASHILGGKTAYVNGSKVTGAMTNFGSGVYQGGDCGIYNNTNFCISTGRSGYIDKAWIYMPFSNVANTLGITASTIAKGYTICGVTGTFTSDANAAAWQILSGKTAYVNGSKVTGTMNNYEGVVTHIDYSRIANNRVEFACAAGYHGCYWAGNSYEYMTYDEVLNLIGCSADKIVSGKSVLNRAGTGANGYNCRTWTYTAPVGTGSSGSAFTLLGGSKTLSSSSWINAASSSHNSYYNGQIDDLRGKINSSSFAVCKISGVDHEIRRSNGYASGSTNASYRYFHDIAIFANTYSDSGNWTVIAGGSGVSSSISNNTKYYPIIYGYWADANKDGGSSSGGSFQDIVFCINTQGAVEVAFRADRTNVLSFKGALKFEFWVFYK